MQQDLYQLAAEAAKGHLPSRITSRGGTPPRSKTLETLRVQAILGLRTSGKMVVLPDGRTCHPTKGFRGGGYPTHADPPVRLRTKRSPLQAAVNKMTNWQRSKYHGMRNDARDVGLLDDDFELELATRALALRRRRA